MLQDVAKLTYSKSCRENSQESRKNKIKNIGGVFTKIYGSEGSNFSSCFLQIKNINVNTFILKYGELYLEKIKVLFFPFLFKGSTT
jgi:hypothetical protein